MSHVQAAAVDPVAEARSQIAEATRASLANHAQNTAKDMAMRRMQSKLKSILPRPLWPLIPGVRGDAVANVKTAIRKRIVGFITGLIITAVFMVFFVLAFAAVFGIVLWQVIANMPA